MKIISYIFIFLSTLTTLSCAHMSMGEPVPRGSPLNPNAPFKDFTNIMAPLGANKPFPCGGYLPDTKIVTTFRACQRINVKFFNQNFLFPTNASNANPKANQARHNGGLNEFALSYDGGQSFTKIATYHKTGPDVFFEWPVKIPCNVPSCDKPGKCLFVWTWLSNTTREFYQNCADIKIVGRKSSVNPLKKIDITKANLPGVFDNIIDVPGELSLAECGASEDSICNQRGSGPSQEDIEANLKIEIDTVGGENKSTLSTTSSIHFSSTKTILTKILTKTVIVTVS